MSSFLVHLSEMLNLRPPPAPKRSCEFCGGVRCFGACGARDAPGCLLSFSGRIVIDGNEFGHVVGEDGLKLTFRRGSSVGMALQQVGAANRSYRIIARVGEGASPEILEVLSVEQETELEPMTKPPSD